MDLVSDAFVSLWDPVKDLVNTAQKGRRGQVERCAEVLEDQSNTILKVVSIIKYQSCWPMSLLYTGGFSFLLAVYRHQKHQRRENHIQSYLWTDHTS